MTELQHEHVQRDLAAMQAAEKKLQAAVQRVNEAKALAEDATRTLELAKTKFHGTVAATKPAINVIYGSGGVVRLETL